jgi:hypothetical protein
MSAFEGSKVLFLSASQVDQLIGLLGLLDLKTTLKTLIDQKLLSLIQNSLSGAQKLFLSILSKETEKVSFKKLPLETWDKKPSSLNTMLHTRGLNRLAKALGPLEDYILQDICLRLSPKDKQPYMSLCTPVETEIKTHLCSELEMTINFIQNQLSKTN